jgi:hypothetical protein
MNYELVYDSETGTILGRMHGFIDAATLMNMAFEVASLIQTYGCYRFLSDAREAIITQSTAELMKIMMISEAAQVPDKCKRAMVVKKVGFEIQFLEAAANTYNRRFKVFTDVEKAIEWLKLEE